MIISVFLFKNFMQKGGNTKRIRKPQEQRRPGLERKMKPQPVFDYPEVKGSGKLKNKIVLITGGIAE